MFEERKGDEIQPRFEARQPKVEPKEELEISIR